ncbi:MAG: hypothetical protein R3301_16255 [Saprospiraceae bacterium]|nr:hypothetical protein [Saprospiraceae bacterium]
MQLMKAAMENDSVSLYIHDSEAFQNKVVAIGEGIQFAGQEISSEKTAMLLIDALDSIDQLLNSYVRVRS